MTDFVKCPCCGGINNSQLFLSLYTGDLYFPARELLPPHKGSWRECPVCEGEGRVPKFLAAAYRLRQSDLTTMNKLFSFRLEMYGDQSRMRKRD